MARYFNLCAPIGHAGVPLPEAFDSHTRSDGKPTFLRSTGTQKPLHTQQRAESNTAQAFLTLPIEIKVRITNILSQYDLLNLASVSKSFYDAAMFSLYENVVIDPSYSYLNDSLKNKPLQRTTFIKTRHNLKEFMSVISQEKQDTPFPLGILVKSLKVVSLPDGVTAHELANFIHKSLPTLTRLDSFYWKDKSRVLPYDTLEHIPNRRNLTSLSVNLDLSKVYGSHHTFPNLLKLSISPFVDSSRLEQFLTKIVFSQNVVSRLTTLQLAREASSLLHKPMGNVNVGQSLVITRYMIDNNLQQPDTSQSDKSINYNNIDCGFWNFLDPVAASGYRFRSLIRLDINSANFLPADSEKVISCIDLQKLEYLSLTNVNEVQIVQDVDYEVHDFTSLALEHLKPSFLTGIVPHFCNLKKLKIDYREAMTDTVPDFIAMLHSVAKVELEELDIVIRWDHTKLATTPDWERTSQRYIKAILKHKRSLKKLSLIAKEESTFYELHKNIPSGTLLQLVECENLQSLRLHGDSLRPSGHMLINKLPHLQFLDLVGKKAGGPPHMGLQVVHDGVLDDWYRVIHVALTLAQGNSSLKFIKIHKCLFECGKSGNVIPRSDGLNCWFEKETRVTLSSEDF